MKVWVWSIFCQLAATNHCIMLMIMCNFACPLFIIGVPAGTTALNPPALGTAPYIEAPEILMLVTSIDKQLCCNLSFGKSVQT